MPLTYILYSEKLNKYYIGACAKIERRLYEHNIGHSKFTSIGTPWKIIYREEYPTLADAIKREKQIKSMKSRKYIDDLILKVEHPIPIAIGINPEPSRSDGRDYYFKAS